MDQSFFNAVVKTCPFLQNNLHVESAERSFKSKSNNVSELGSRKDRPRVPHELVFAVGGFTTKACSTVEVFDIRAQRWCPVQDSVFPSHAYHGAAALDGKLFVLGGFGEDEDGPEHYESAYCMDLSSQVWARKSAMQNRRCYVSVAELQGKVYCIGGYNGHLRFNTVECFDPNTNQWTMVKPMNKVRSDACAVAFDNKIVVLGGFNGEEIHQSIEIYDPESDEWIFGPTMSQPRSGLKAVVLNNKIYVMGGFNGAERLKSVEILDKLDPNASWIPAGELITQRSNFGATVVNKQIMVAGGFDGHQVISDTEFYSEETNQWTPSQPMDLKRSALSLATVTGLPNRKNYLTRYF
jgi:kelch-like protein 10